VGGLLPPLPLFIAFLTASFVLAVTPGPGVLFIVTKSLSQGRSSGLASVAGVALGNLGNAIGASVGLAAIFLLSSAAFVAVKYLGAAYLIYIGLRTILGPDLGVPAAGDGKINLPLSQIFRDGFVVALLNPKTALFFAAFLPQFLHSDSGHLAESVVLGAIFVVIAAVTDSMYALLAGSLRPLLLRSKVVGAPAKYVSGGVFIGLGLLTAATGGRSRVGQTP